jgi:hypothetical protein
MGFFLIVNFGLSPMYQQFLNLSISSFLLYLNKVIISFELYILLGLGMKREIDGLLF